MQNRTEVRWRRPRYPWLRFALALSLASALVLSVSGLHPVAQIGPEASLDEFIEYLTDRIPALISTYGIPGVSTVLIYDGEIVWFEAFGYSDLESGQKMTPQTYCRVQSISKPVTAWGVMRLVEEGKIALDDPIHQHLAGFRLPPSDFSGDRVSIRQLLSHTSGMAMGRLGLRYSPLEERPSLLESLSEDVHLQQEPGSSFHYSNAGFNLLELLIEDVTLTDFSEYMEEQILVPLSMRQSSFTWSEDFDPPVPFGHDLKGDRTEVYVYSERASGGLFASALDIGRFLTAGMDGSEVRGRGVLSPEAVDMLHTVEVEIGPPYGLAFDSYGLGHYIETLSDGKYAISHGGQGYGWMSHFHSVPATGDGIVILANSQRSWPFFSYVLSDWAAWRGFPSVGMGRIVLAKRILWGLIGFSLFALFTKLWGLTEELMRGDRSFAPLSRICPVLRLIQALIALSIAALLIYVADQDYLFISSVFPIASLWIFITLLAASVLLTLLSLLPHRGSAGSRG